MNKKWFYFIFFIIALLPSVLGDEITFSVNQTEYYFLVGEEAMISIETENNYDKEIIGMMTHTINHEINQQGFQYSSSNTNSQQFSVGKGNNVVNLAFGSSADPAVLKVKLSFNYDDKEKMVVDLDEIVIHFVKEESQKQNQENQMESSSEKVSEQQNEQEQQNNQQQSQEQQEQYSQQQSETQQKANSMQQNTQQDMNSLKNQMQQEMQEIEQMKQEFGENVENNSEFKEAMEQLEKAGYKPESKELNPTDNESGDFKYDFKKENGETASISGSMEEGNMEEMVSETSEEMQQMKEALENDTKFKEMKEELEKNGFEMEEPQIDKITTNEAQANVPFMNPTTNQTANITADFENTTEKPTNITLHEESGNMGFLWAFILVLIVIIGLMAYNKYFRKDKKIVHLDEIQSKKEKIDYRKNAREILRQAKEFFDTGKQKEAYTKVSKGVRYFYKYELNFGKEMARDMVIRELKARKKGYKKATECLDLCDLVKFAKYETNKKDFEKILRLAEEIIK